MAVTVAQLAVALRLSTDPLLEPNPAISSLLTRQLGVAEAFIEVYAPDAPQDVKNEATIRMAGYLFDSPTAPSQQRYTSIFYNSGASALLAPWMDRRAAQAAQDAAADKPSLDDLVAEIAPFAREHDPTGHIAPERVAENPVADSIPVVAANGRSFRYVETSTLGGGPTSLGEQDIDIFPNTDNQLRNTNFIIPNTAVFIYISVGDSSATKPSTGQVSVVDAAHWRTLPTASQGDVLVENPENHFTLTVFSRPDAITLTRIACGRGAGARLLMSTSTASLDLMPLKVWWI